MTVLVQQRCAAHPSREAAARCPSCRQPFCRECVTEHDGRVLCAGCLRKLATSKARRPLRLGFLWRPVQIALGLGLAWFAFYLIGMALLQTPAAWHEGKAMESWLMNLPGTP
jgi:hypothetical protein